jgi:hypothetical protein
MYIDDLEMKIEHHLPRYLMLAKQKDNHKEIMDVKLIVAYIYISIFKVKSVIVAKKMRTTHSTILYRNRICSDRLLYDRKFIAKFGQTIKLLKNA